MHLAQARSLYSTLAVLLISGVFATSLSAQRPKVPAPHRPLAPRIDKRLPWGKPMARQSATGGLWMNGEGWKASLNLTNGLKTDPIMVMPVLYLSNGKRYQLSPVTLEPSGTAIVDIGQGLENVGIVPYAMLYGYVEIEYQWPWAAVSATLKNVDVVNSMIFIFGLQPSPDWHSEHKQWRLEHKDSLGVMLPASFEGLWWKQEKDVSGFLGLSNVTGKPIHATVRLTDKNDVQLANYDVTVLPHGTKMVALDELKASASDSGGIYLTHDGPEGGLDINGGLLDQAVGFSAHLPMHAQPQPSSPAQPQSPQSVSFSELYLMTGAADPMMNFPSGTVFTPYSLVRNISGEPAEVTPELWWMSSGSAQSAALPQMTISPHQTVNLNVPGLLVAAGLKNFSGSVNLILNTKMQPGGLLFSSGSVDQKNTYVFEVVAHGIAEGFAKEICYWSTGNGDDTMVTLWNAADEPQDLAFTLFFSGGQYVYQIHLGPRETRALNVSQILHSSIPDAAGNLIPAGISEGSAEIAGSLGEDQHVLISLDVAVYNVRKATCGTVCWECDGIVSASIYLSPFGVAVAGTTGETFYETTNTGYQRGASASWKSSNTSIATVNSGGVVSGVRAGSLTLSAYDLYSETDGVGWYCTDINPYCPTSYFQGSGGGTTQPPPTVSFSILNYVLVGQNATINATVTSGNILPISLSISSSAGIISPTGTFTSSTPVVVKGLSAGTATITATISNADGGKRTVGSTSFTVASYQGVRTPNDNFSGRSTTTFGVGEVINLSANISPPGVTAANLGGLQWSIVSGGGNLTGSTDGTGTYTAPATGASVVLKLSGAGTSYNYNLTVIAPSGAHLTKFSNLRHKQGFLGVGFQANAFLEPSNVSFANVKFAEGTVAGVGSGFFASLNGRIHPATPTPLSVGSCNTATGCEVQSYDTVDTGDYAGPYSVGDFLWAIPWQYQIGGGALTQFTTANHHQTADATGMATISKATAGPYSKNLNDPTSTY